MSLCVNSLSSLEVFVYRSEVNETLMEVIGQYIAAVYDDVMPDYVIVGDGKNYSSNITNVSLLSLLLLLLLLLNRSITR